MITIVDNWFIMQTQSNFFDKNYFDNVYYTNYLLYHTIW